MDFFILGISEVYGAGFVSDIYSKRKHSLYSDEFILISLKLYYIRTYLNLLYR